MTWALLDSGDNIRRLRCHDMPRLSIVVALFRTFIDLSTRLLGVALPRHPMHMPVCHECHLAIRVPCSHSEVECQPHTMIVRGIAQLPCRAYYNHASLHIWAIVGTMIFITRALSRSHVHITAKFIAS